MKSLLRLFMLLVVVVTSTCSVACNMVFGLDELVLKEDASDLPREDSGRDATDGGRSDVAYDATTDPSDTKVTADADATMIVDGGDATDGPPIEGGRTDAPPDISNPPTDAPRDDASDSRTADDAPRDNDSVPTDAPPDMVDASDASDGGVVDPLMSITITPANSTVAQGGTRQLTATGTYAVSGARDITTLVNWSTNDATIGSVSDTNGTKGVVSGSSPGTMIITAALGGVSGTTNITVTAVTLVSISVTPSNSTVPLGRTVSFTATGTFSDTTTQNLTASATWAATAGVASMNSAPCCPGEASTVGMGTATITASIGAVSGSTSLTVGPVVLDTLVITPPNPSIPAGTSLQLTATGTYSNNTMADLTASATWESNDPSQADVGDTPALKGKVTAGPPGAAAIISATIGAIKATTTVTVTAPILQSITVSGQDVAVGDTVVFTATGHYSNGASAILSGVTWDSTKINVATVSGVGEVTGLSVGTTTISATSGAITGSLAISVIFALR